MTTPLVTCARCEGSGEVWNYAGDPDAGDLRACPDCAGSGDVPLRTPAATARRESAAPHGCTGVHCATCGDDTPAANAVAQWEARVAEATAELAHARDGLLRAKGDDTPALVRYTVARLLRGVLLPCAARIAATATTAAEWHDVAVEAAAVSVATRSEKASAAYAAAVLMEGGDVEHAAMSCAAHAGESVEAWRTHTRWVIADGNNDARGA